MKRYLIKLGEISLKGQNRNIFQKRLAKNIKDKFEPYKVNIQSQKGRLFATSEEEIPYDIAKKVLSTTFGLDGWAECVSSKDKTVEGLNSFIDAEIQKDGWLTDIFTFKVITKREDKKFPLNSYEISCLAADKILTKNPNAKVNLKNPEKILYIEIRKEIYIYSSLQKGVRGLPVGTAGQGLSLLSGGIDSPVSTYLMASRGLRQELLYFHAYPYTTDEAKEKVVELARKLSPYLNGAVLHIVSFTELEIQIQKHGFEREKTLMLRASMIKAAEMLAKKRRLSCLVTGEALAQVASQTLEALDFTSSFTDMNILRPLVGLEKETIIRYAQTIGTFETSILPYQDCCVLFSPKHPKTKPERNKLILGFERLNLDSVIRKAVDESTTIYIKPNLHENL